MLLGFIGLVLIVFGIVKARYYRGQSLDLWLAAVGLQLAGVVLLVGAL